MPAIVVLLVGSFILTFVVLKTNLRLFSNALIQREKQEDVMKIIDMFHGNVLIVDTYTSRVLFVKRKQEENFHLTDESDVMIREDRVFKIVDNLAMKNERRDQVRLYDNEPNAPQGEFDPL